MQRERELLSWLNLAVDSLIGNQSAPNQLCDGLLAREDKVRIIAEIIRLPSCLNRKISQWLISEVNIDPFVYLILNVPLFRLTTNPYQLLLILLLQGIILKIIVFCPKQLRKRLNAVILKHIAEVIDMETHANLLNLVDWRRKSEVNYKRANSEVLSVLHIYSLFGDVHPCTVLTAKIQHIEVFEPVKFQLSMFGRQPSSLNLQSQSVQFSVSCSKYFSIFMGGDVKKAIFEDALDAVQYILDLQFCDFCDIDLMVHGIEVVLLDEVHLVLVGLSHPTLLLCRGIAFSCRYWLGLPDSVLGDTLLGDVGFVHFLVFISAQQRDITFNEEMKRHQPLLWHFLLLFERKDQRF